jgi:3-hydroxyisobutyrate dehydrogenase
MATIGFAGLGHMGTPMAGRLAAAGHRLRVFDIAAAARARLRGLDGVAVVSQVAEIADGADVVILMLPDSAIVAQVLLADGLLEHVASSAVVVDMSSSVPARTRELARTAAERGVTLVDAPVSGGVAGAQSGSLTIMVGGPVDVLDRLRPVLEVLGSHVVHAGEFVGAGHAIKALNNLMSAAHLLASSEALLAGRQFGLDPDVMLSIVNSSSGRSGSTQVKWPKFILPQAYDSGFGLRLMLKDMRIALQLEQEVGVPAPIGQAAVAAWAAAAEDLPAAADHTEIARWLAAQIDQSKESERPLPICFVAAKQRVMSITPADLMRVPRRVGVAGGAGKCRAIRAALRGAWVNVLVTDLDTARALVEDTEARPADLLSAEGLG